MQGQEAKGLSVLKHRDSACHQEGLGEQNQQLPRHRAPGNLPQSALRATAQK